MDRDDEDLDEIFPDKTPEAPKDRREEIREYLANLFDFRTDKEDDFNTLEMVRADVDFRGTKLWILICAIFVASLGLNTNSTAVIIGAMLISPLSAPAAKENPQILSRGSSTAHSDCHIWQERTR